MGKVVAEASEQTLELHCFSCYVTCFATYCMVATYSKVLQAHVFGLWCCQWRLLAYSGGCFRIFTAHVFQKTRKTCQQQTETTASLAPFFPCFLSASGRALYLFFELRGTHCENGFQRCLRWVCQMLLQHCTQRMNQMSMASCAWIRQLLSAGQLTTHAAGWGFEPGQSRVLFFTVLCGGN